MENRTIGWISLLFLLFSTTFGFFWCLTILVGAFTFLAGFVSLLYVQQGDIDRFYRNYAGNPLSVESVSDGGLEQVVNKATTPEKVQKTDHRVTGSELIDSSLQEILGYIIRDYVTPWYSHISLDDEFPHKYVRKSAQTFAINISNSIKDIDWIPFLTTRLVDDAATHLRLFKQARTKMKNDEKHTRSPRNSPRKDIKSSPRKSHKRNKSETDVSWYFGGSKSFLERKAERNVGRSKFYAGADANKKVPSLEDYFFDLECTMENNVICRDLICMDVEKEKEFLSELVELLLYILLPDEDFECQPLRFVLREIFANCVIFPVFTLISDPDYINQAIIWLCLRDYSLSSEIFLTALRLTDNCDELRYTKDLVSKEIQMLRSRDSGGESDLSIKQQLSSLSYVLKLIDNRLSKVDNFEILDSIAANDYPIPTENLKAIELPLDFMLKNNVALSYFIDYVASHGIQAYLFFYLNIEGWKVSVEQQLSDIHINKLKGINENPTGIYQNIRSTAKSIYDQYLGDKREQKVDINPGLVHKLFFRIRNLSEAPSDQWFDEIQAVIYDKMKEFLPAFKQSHSYLKLLEELDLLHQPTEDDALSLNSLEGFEDELAKNSLSSNVSSRPLKCNNSDPYLLEQADNKNIKHVRSLSDVTNFNTKSADESNKLENVVSDAIVKCSEKKPEQKNLGVGEFVLEVNIIETGVVSEKGKTFGIYAVQVSRKYETGFVEEWHIYRRYSDFYDLYVKVKEKFPDLSKLTFPGKKTFHNMDRAVLERRMRMLGSYMQNLCRGEVINNHHGLKSLLMVFLEQGEYDRATLGGPISHTIDTIVNPLKSGMKTIKNMPEQIFNTVDEVVEGINKVFHSKQGQKNQETIKVGASIDVESDDNIPLRIMLLLMDEVFDLKSRNQWLRKRIITLLRQIVRTMFGDIVNRRILDYVSFITSPKNVAHYLHLFKHSFWPNGVKAERKAERDEGVKSRTRIAAKIALLSCLSDELKHIIGSETTRKGLLTVFELFQRPTLNRRLVYVLLEGIVCTLFPEKNMPSMFQKLHSKSKRYQDKQKAMTGNRKPNLPKGSPSLTDLITHYLKSGSEAKKLKSLNSKESSEESSSSEEEKGKANSQPAVVKTPQAINGNVKQTPGKKPGIVPSAAAAKKNESSSDDSSSEEEEKTPAAKAPQQSQNPTKKLPVQAGQKKQVSSSDSSSDEEEEKTKLTTPKTPLGKAQQQSATKKIPPQAAQKKQESSSEDSSDDEEEAKQPAPKTNLAKNQQQQNSVKKPSQVTLKKQASSSSEDSSDEEEAVKKPASLKTPPTKVQQQKIPPNQPALKKQVSSSEDSSDEEEKPPAKTTVQPKVAAQKPASSDSEESSSEEAATVKIPSKAQVKAPQAPKPATKKAASSSEDSDSSEDVKPTPAKVVQKPPAPKKADSSDDSSSEEESKSKITSTPAPKPIVKKKQSSSEDSSSEEDAPKKPPVNSTPIVKPTQKKREESSDDSESDDEPPAKKLAANSSTQVTPKKAASSDEDSSSGEVEQKAKPSAQKLAKKAEGSSEDSSEDATPKKQHKKKKKESKHGGDENEETVATPKSKHQKNEEDPSSGDKKKKKDKKRKAGEMENNEEEEEGASPPQKKPNYNNFVKGKKSFDGNNSQEGGENSDRRHSFGGGRGGSFDGRGRGGGGKFGERGGRGGFGRGGGGGFGRGGFGRGGFGGGYRGRGGDDQEGGGFRKSFGNDGGRGRGGFRNSFGGGDDKGGRGGGGFRGGRGGFRGDRDGFRGGRGGRGGGFGGGRGGGGGGFNKRDSSGEQNSKIVFDN